MEITLVADSYAICRLGAGEKPPESPDSTVFWSQTLTPDETSLVCPSSMCKPGWSCDHGWSLMRVAGPLSFKLTGILNDIVGPLAVAEIPVFVTSTYDTDYFLVKTECLEDTVRVLEDAGHRVLWEGHRQAK